MAVRRHFEKPVRFFKQLFAHFALKSQILNFAAVNVRFFLNIFTVAKLVRDNFKLLTQVIFALILVNAVLHLLENVVLNIQNVVLIFEHGGKHFKALYIVRFLKNVLLILRVDIQITSEELAEQLRVIGGKRLYDHFLRHFRNEICIFVK